MPFNLPHYPFCPLQRCCPHPLRHEGSGAMGPGVLSSLLLLLFLVATGDADMKGHFDPGEETASWVPEEWGLGDRVGALTPGCLYSPSQVPLCPGHAGPDHPRWGHLCFQLLVRLHGCSPQQVSGTLGPPWRELLGPPLALPTLCRSRDASERANAKETPWSWRETLYMRARGRPRAPRSL